MLLQNPPVPPQSKTGLLPNEFKAQPYFSQRNPYWQRTMPYLRLELQPRPSMIDYLAAAWWELSRPFDVFGACLVRQACTRTTSLQLKLKSIQINKENANAKAA